jgi:hypothetical protein
MVYYPPTDKRIVGIRCEIHGYKFFNGCVGCSTAIAIWVENKQLHAKEPTV